MNKLEEQVKTSPICMARIRLYNLTDLEQMLDSFYDFYNHEVDKPYLVHEQRTIVRLVKLIAFQLQDKTMPVGIIESVNELKRVHFRFVLPEQNPFSVAARISCLQQLEDYLVRFFDLFGCRSIGVPYSVVEQLILKRIKKLLLHQLRGTDKYQMFKKKCPSYVERVTPKEEMQELQDQQKDEKLLKAVSGRITKINPHSKKYRALKEEQLRKIQEMD